MSISTFLRVTIVFAHFRQDRILRQATDFEMTGNIFARWSYRHVLPPVDTIQYNYCYVLPPLDVLLFILKINFTIFDSF